MSYFDIQGYEPRWLNGLSSIAAAHDPRLQALVGSRLRRIWLLWDLDDDEWFADAPVLLDFGHDQVEINHQKFDERKPPRCRATGSRRSNCSNTAARTWPTAWWPSASSSRTAG